MGLDLDPSSGLFFLDAPSRFLTDLPPTGFLRSGILRLPSGSLPTSEPCCPGLRIELCHSVVTSELSGLARRENSPVLGEVHSLIFSTPHQELGI